MAEPPGRMPVAAGGGHLRASHADREQAVGTLKAAFVIGMLAKDEFDLRVGRALASRTYGELAALTADLSAGLAKAKPPLPAPALGEPRIPRPGRVLAVATAVYAAVWAVALVIPTTSEGEPQEALWLVPSTTLFYILLLLTIGTPVLADWLNKRW